MAQVHVDHVSLDLEVLGHNSRSLRRNLINVSTGGRLMQDASDKISVRALDDVSFELADGDKLGLYGHNGAGKTTLLRCIAGIYEPTKGQVRVDGQISSLLDVNIGLDYEATGRENIETLLVFRGVSRRQMAAAVPEIEDFTELGLFLDLPVKTYSAGMVTRLGFAVATSVAPDILLMDEWLSTGDARFMVRAQAHLKSFVSKASVLVLASHSVPLLKDVCSKVAVMEHGRIVKFGSPDEVLT